MKGSRDAALLVLLLLIALSVRLGGDLSAPAFDEVQAASPAGELADLPPSPDEVAPCPLKLDVPDRPALGPGPGSPGAPARRTTAAATDECRT